MTPALPIVNGSQVPGSPQPVLRIGDLAKKTDKTNRAVRLYEEMGLLGAVHRTEGGHRVYTGDAVARINWIDKLQALGFSLTQIRSLLDDWADSRFGPSAMSKIRALFREKLDETRAQMLQLEALAIELEDSLSYLASCEACEPNTVLGSCTGCDQPHPVDQEPALVAGFRKVRTDRISTRGIEDEDQ